MVRPLASSVLQSRPSPWVPPRQCVGVCRRRRMPPKPEPADRAAKEHEGTVHANDPAVAVLAGRATPRGREAAPLARLVPRPAEEEAVQRERCPEASIAEPRFSCGRGNLRVRDEPGQVEEPRKSADLCPHPCAAARGDCPSHSDDRKCRGSASGNDSKRLGRTLCPAGGAHGASRIQRACRRPGCRG